MCHLKQIHEYRSRFQCLESVLDDVRVLRYDPNEVVCVGFGEKGEVGSEERSRREGNPPGYRAKPGVSVLKIGTGVSFKGGHGVHIEIVVVDSMK